MKKLSRLKYNLFNLRETLENGYVNIAQEYWEDMKDDFEEIEQMYQEACELLEEAQEEMDKRK